MVSDLQKMLLAYKKELGDGPVVTVFLGFGGQVMVRISDQVNGELYSHQSALTLDFPVNYFVEQQCGMFKQGVESKQKAAENGSDVG